MLILFMFLIDIILNQQKFYNLDIDEECKGNLECKSACCHKRKCCENNDCLFYKVLIYALDGAFCLIFLVIVTIYMKKEISKIKNELHSEMEIQKNINEKLMYNENRNNNSNNNIINNNNT
jgi:hypothetical protein